MAANSPLAASDSHRNDDEEELYRCDTLYIGVTSRHLTF
jgi:hypothetical protein